jgi:hypothetical protein
MTKTELYIVSKNGPVEPLAANDIDRTSGIDVLRDILRDGREPKLVKPKHLVRTVSKFLDEFVSPDYLIDGIMRRRYF